MGERELSAPGFPTRSGALLEERGGRRSKGGPRKGRLRPVVDAGEHHADSLVVGSAAMATDPPIEARRIRHFRVALSRNTVELPWASRAPLLERVRKHDQGLQVVIAFEAVGSTLPVRLEPAGKRVLLQVVEAWLGQVTVDGLPAGVWKLRNELQNELADGELGDA
jgi:hypothetical protein